ncbi:phosphotransferase [Streptomyces sp. 549]|uniref:phosphotransferase n=1 Tax=Streptomyces sp. 549 TaxID=3049076 RepID=UPI0024C26958|nr:phosphotransferase [Streptomyces sp. 549]MDK1475674.1 phosphotransferase [Streptomyces sp. 549]
MTGPRAARALPPPSVLDAFAVGGTVVPLPGGRGLSVRVGNVVLKPVDGTEEEAEWAASVYERLLAGAGGFRVPRPLRAADGRSVVDGWTGCELLSGRPGPAGHWHEVLAAGRAFHAALSDVPCPAFLSRRTHPWAVADRVAWGEEETDVPAQLADPYAALLALRRPVRLPVQLVHGDLTGNVLLAAGEPPGVIDFSPYWRPPVYAEAVVVADGLLWFDAPRTLLARPGECPDWTQLLVRALLFRLVAAGRLAGPTARVTEEEAARYTRTIETVRRGPSAGRR